MNVYRNHLVSDWKPLIINVDIIHGSGSGTGSGTDTGTGIAGRILILLTGIFT